MRLFGKHFEQLIKPSGKFSVFYSHRLVAFAGPDGMSYLRKVYSVLMEAAFRLGGDIYLSDGIFAWGRVIGWIRDKKFREAVEMAEPSDRNAGVDSAIAWRTHVACWASSQACKVKGDFFEFGCYEGYTAAVIRSFLGDNFNLADERTYFWFDMFAGGEGGVQKTISLDQSRSEIMASMRAKKFDDVCLVKGNVISTYIENLGLSSRKIAFAHFDLNGFDIEKSILEAAIENVSSGSVFLFDDFAMVPFREQNKFYRDFFREKGFEILELPTGQGLVIF